MTTTGSLVLSSLTNRQRQILALLCDGIANKEIAAEFCLRHQMVECPCRHTPGVQHLIELPDFGLQHARRDFPALASPRPTNVIPNQRLSRPLVTC